MFAELLALIVDESRWLTVSLAFALLAAIFILRRPRPTAVTVRSRVEAALGPELRTAQWHGRLEALVGDVLPDHSLHWTRPTGLFTPETEPRRIALAVTSDRRARRRRRCRFAAAPYAIMTRSLGGRGGAR